MNWIRKLFSLPCSNDATYLLSCRHSLLMMMMMMIESFNKTLHGWLITNHHNRKHVWTCLIQMVPIMLNLTIAIYVNNNTHSSGVFQYRANNPKYFINWDSSHHLCNKKKWLWVQFTTTSIVHANDWLNCLFYYQTPKMTRSNNDSKIACTWVNQSHL